MQVFCIKKTSALDLYLPLYPCIYSDSYDSILNKNILKVKNNYHRYDDTNELKIRFSFLLQHFFVLMRICFLRAFVRVMLSV